MRPQPCVRIVNTLVLLAALVTIPFATAGSASAVEPDAYPTDSPAQEPSLQFTSAGHVVCFESKTVTIASATHMLRTEFFGARNVVPTADGDAAGDHSVDVVPLGLVTYRDLWPGVTLTYETSADAIAKSTYYLDCGAAVAAIRLRFNRPVSLDNEGNLLVSFDTGAMVESAPVAWQELDGCHHPVDVAFVLRGQNEVGFVLGDHLPDLPVVIDPWLTFLGSQYGDYAKGIVVDPDGNIYVTGYGYEWPETPVRGFSGNSDAFVAKLASDGEMEWLTYLGGVNGDGASGIALGADGDVYVVGASGGAWTESPVRAYATHIHFSGDAFVARVNPNGTLEWHTFLGGAGADYGQGIALDDDGNILVTGVSAYLGWAEEPVREFSAGEDVFVAKLSGAGSLVWHTFLGGSEDDRGCGIDVDSAGSVYVVGTSCSAWIEEADRGYSGGIDGFVAGLDSSGSLVWHTFLGTAEEDNDDDRAQGVVADDSGNVFVVGYGEAEWGPAPVRPHSGGYDAFAAMLDADDGSLSWNTFLGGTSVEEACCIALDDSGNVYLAGRSWATWGEPEQAHTDTLDGMIVRLDSTGILTWHTFLGGTAQEQCHAIDIDADGRILVAGEDNGTWDSPVRPSAGGSEGFVFQTVPADAPQTVSLDLKTGWNMVSVPLELDDASRAAVFPPADVVAVYTWNPVTKSYEVPTDIAPEVGYWVAVTEDTTIKVTGTPVTSWEDHPLIAGWNMVGSVYGNSVAAGDLITDVAPDPLLRSAIYWWDPVGKSYVAATQVEEGLGYWMATTENCNLTMQPSA